MSTTPLDRVDNACARTLRLLLPTIRQMRRFLVMSVCTLAPFQAPLPCFFA